MCHFGAAFPQYRRRCFYVDYMNRVPLLQVDHLFGLCCTAHIFVCTLKLLFSQHSYIFRDTATFASVAYSSNATRRHVFVQCRSSLAIWTHAAFCHSLSYNESYLWGVMSLNCQNIRTWHTGTPTYNPGYCTLSTRSLTFRSHR